MSSPASLRHRRVQVTAAPFAALVAALCVLAAPASAQTGQSVFAVSVADAQSGAPLPGVEIFLPELKLLQRTDSMGQARIPGVPLGIQRVRVRHLGFVASDVQLKFAGDTTGAVFRLDRTAVPVSGVDITATAVPEGLKDFEVRRKQGLGRFLTEKDLAKDGSRDFLLVAANRFPGLMTRSDTDGRPHLVSSGSNCGGGAAGRVSTDNRGIERIGAKPGIKPSMGTRGIEGEPQMTGSCASEMPCLVQVWLDNIQMGESDADLVRTWDLSGAEFYSGSTVPARYRTSGAACGVLLLWSKWTDPA